ncbi:MAG: type 4a pilus biogenesis protein PilO [Phycisphaerales bacterium]|nr:type 4a pilus biogenesis protein PilO [Phycisphaerales bacterium]
MNNPSTLAGRVLTVDACGLLAIMGIAAAGYFFGAAPVINARAEIDARTHALEDQARSAAGQESLIVGEQRKLVDLERQLSVIQIELFPPTDINKRLKRITELCVAEGLSIQQLDPGQAKPAGELGKFTIVPIRIVGTGSFNGICGFLHTMLENEYPDVEVRTLNAAAPADGQADGAFVIELRWYAAPAADAVSAGAETVK